MKQKGGGEPGNKTGQGPSQPLYITYTHIHTQRLTFSDFIVVLIMHTDHLVIGIIRGMHIPDASSAGPVLRRDLSHSPHWRELGPSH